MSRKKVLCFIIKYPTFSETYMHEEIRSLYPDYDIRIVTLNESRTPRRDPFPFTHIQYQAHCIVYGRLEYIDESFSSPEQQRFVSEVEKIIAEFQPDILHGHYFGMAFLLRHLAERNRLPFTIRSHSMDMLSEPEPKLRALSRICNSYWCLGVLAFPPLRDRILEFGIREERLIDCWPVLNFERFYKPESRPLTKRVMCGGPAIKKKAHKDFLQLASRMKDSELEFHLYTRGDSIKVIEKLNESMGRPVLINYADPDDMPDVYPQYDWLVYPADPVLNKVGLPCSIPEAQASGLGVCFQELPGRREEQLEFLGGGGFLFSSIEEVPELISKPYPEAMRQAGFSAAKRCDIGESRNILIGLWNEGPKLKELDARHDLTVSVIVPYFENADTINETLRSALNQDYENIEIVVVDDASAERPAARSIEATILPRIKVIELEKNRGNSAARNEGIKSASGDYLVTLDADDVLEPSFVRECLRAAFEFSRKVVYSRAECFGNSSYELSPEVNLINLLCHKEGFPTLLFHREVFEKTGGYRESLRVGSDHQFLLDIVAKGYEPVAVDRPLWRHRRHTTGLSTIGVYGRMASLLQNNSDLYEENWRDVVLRQERYYLDLYSAYQECARQLGFGSDDALFKPSSGGSKSEHADYDRVLGAYRQVAAVNSALKEKIENQTKQLGKLRDMLNRYFYLGSTGNGGLSLRRYFRGLIRRIEDSPSESNSSDRALLVDSGIIDERFYTLACAQRGIEIQDPVSHFLSQGWSLDIDPSPLFDLSFYVKQADKIGLPCHENPVLNYLKLGADLGLKTSVFFDSGFYMRTYPDVVDAKVNPLTHFIKFGALEGRMTMPLESWMVSSSDLSPHERQEVEVDEISLDGLEFDVVVALHEASRTGAPLLGLDILNSLKAKRLQPLVVLQNGGELSVEIRGNFPCIDLGGVANKGEVLAARLQSLVSTGRFRADKPVVMLNSAELHSLSGVFKDSGFSVVSLVHEFMSCYPLRDHEHLLDNSDILVFSSELTRRDSRQSSSLKVRSRLLPQGWSDLSFGTGDKAEAGRILREELGLDSDSIVVLACGTAEVRKGIDLFVQTAIKVSKDIENVHFVWVGGMHKSGPEALDWAMRDARSSGVSSRLHFVGSKDCVEKYFTGADIFLLPSRLDPLPRVLHMAMSSSLPVVAFSGAGGAQEVLSLGGGRLVPYLEMDEMVRAVTEYAKSSSSRKSDGAAGRRILEEHYGFDSYVDSLLEVSGVSTTAFPALSGARGLS